MAAVPLFRNTNMTAVTSRENTLDWRPLSKPFDPQLKNLLCLQNHFMKKILMKLFQKSRNYKKAALEQM